MSTPKSVEIHIPSTLGSEKLAMARAAEVARKLGFSEDRVEDLKTAVAEACTNAIEHGHQFNDSIRVGISMFVDSSGMQVTVSDRGNGLKADVSPPDIEDKIEGREHSRGWGMFLIQQLVDDVQFEKMPEGTNEVRLIIHLHAASLRSPLTAGFPAARKAPITESAPIVPGPAPAVAPHRGGTLLVLGVIGLAFFPLGAAAWSMGNRDLDLMEEGRVDRGGEGLTRAPKVLGVLSVVGACVVFGFAFLTMFLLSKTLAAF